MCECECNLEKTYVGVKIVKAFPCHAEQAGRILNRPINTENAEGPDHPGYLVTYPDGYRSWCPKKQFEKYNRLMDDCL